jgi:hypothetical protein
MPLFSDVSPAIGRRVIRTFRQRRYAQLSLFQPSTWGGGKGRAVGTLWPQVGQCLGRAINKSGRVISSRNASGVPGSAFGNESLLKVDSEHVRAFQSGSKSPGAPAS